MVIQDINIRKIIPIRMVQIEVKILRFENEIDKKEEQYEAKYQAYMEIKVKFGLVYKIFLIIDNLLLYLILYLFFLLNLFSFIIYYLIFCFNKNKKRIG